LSEYLSTGAAALEKGFGMVAVPWGVIDRLAPVLVGSQDVRGAQGKGLRG